MPIVNGKYKNPGWSDNTPPPINAAELNAISDTLEKLDAMPPLPSLANPGSAGDLLAGKQLIDANGNVLTGTMPSKAAQTYTPSTKNQTISAGQYLSGVQIISGDPNLVPGNIKSGVSIFGVNGDYEGGGVGLQFQIRFSLRSLPVVSGNTLTITIPATEYMDGANTPIELSKIEVLKIDAISFGSASPEYTHTNYLDHYLTGILLFSPFTQNPRVIETYLQYLSDPGYYPSMSFIRKISEYNSTYSPNGFTISTAQRKITLTVGKYTNNNITYLAPRYKGDICYRK